MAEIARKAERYPIDLTNDEWPRIQLRLPGMPTRGRKPKTNLREVLTAIRTKASSGGG